MVQSVSSPSLSRTHCFNYTLVQHAAPLSLLFLLMKDKHLWAREKTRCASVRQTADISRRGTLANSPYSHTCTQTNRTHAYRFTNTRCCSFFVSFVFTHARTHVPTFIPIFYSSHMRAPRHTHRCTLGLGDGTNASTYC